MKWAVEIKTTKLQRRNLTDLLSGLGYDVLDIASGVAFTSSSLDSLITPAEVWSEAKRLRAAMTGPAEIDPDFTLGAVVDCSTREPKRHYFLEAQSGQLTVTGGIATLTVSPPSGLSEEELAKWKAARAEQEYQAKLESQRSKLEPVFRSNNAAKILELLRREDQTGETLFKVYELVEGHPSNRKSLHARFGIAETEFDRFSDAVHNPAVSGDLARHAYHKRPKTSRPMTFGEAKAFIDRLVRDWFAAIRTGSDISK